MSPGPDADEGPNLHLGLLVQQGRTSEAVMIRRCPQCSAQLKAETLRCACGFVYPEARDLLSDPDSPRCGVCRQPMELMAQACPSCGADGYPALRARRGKKTLGAPQDAAEPSA